MKNLARRLATLERQPRFQPPPPPSDGRRMWPERFAQHSPANAELLTRIRGWMEVHARNCLTPGLRWFDPVDMMLALCAFIGFEIDENDEYRYPASPTSDEREVIALWEEITAAQSKYEEATGDMFPPPFSPR